MPLYVYAVIEPDDSDGETFEVLQDLNEPPLTVHPVTGQPVRRVISAPNVKVNRPGLKKPDLSPKNLERLGLTQYRKSATGKYEKTAGAGPDSITRE
jgi:predicted nucleic acid-binding Zn ribbon protein